VTADTSGRGPGEQAGATSSAVAASTADPELTVVIVVGERRRRGARALGSVLSQEGIERVEVLLVDQGGNGAGPLSGAEHPSVRVMRVAPPAHFGVARTAAVREARAPVVAFLEEHCEALPGWIAGMIAAHRGEWTAVASQVHNLNPGEGASDVICLRAYGPWMHPSPSGRRSSLPGHNVSFKRDVLLAFGEELSELLLIDTVLLQYLASEGHGLYLAPDAGHAHLNERSLLTFAPIYWHWNRCFGHLRPRYLRWSRPRRFLHILGAPLVPLVRLAKLTVFVGRRRPGSLPTLLWGVPRILFADAVAGFGQATGMVFGAGDSPERFSDLEMNLARTRHGNE
jgi:hypothetical protein